MRLFALFVLALLPALALAQPLPPSPDEPPGLLAPAEPELPTAAPAAPSLGVSMTATVRDADAGQAPAGDDPPVLGSPSAPSSAATPPLPPGATHPSTHPSAGPPDPIPTTDVLDAGRSAYGSIVAAIREGGLGPWLLAIAAVLMVIVAGLRWLGVKLFTDKTLLRRLMLGLAATAAILTAIAGGGSWHTALDVATAFLAAMGLQQGLKGMRGSTA